MVPQDSAILPGYLHTSLHCDHRNMTKFASVDDPGFIRVTNHLRRWVSDIPQGITMATAPVNDAYQEANGKSGNIQTAILLNQERYWTKLIMQTQRNCTKNVPSVMH